MQHLHDDALALLALGEEPAPEEAGHLESCARCRAEVQAYGRVVRAGRRAEPVAGSLPSPDVWDRVHGTLGLGTDVRSDPLQAARTGSPAGTGRGPHASVRDSGNTAVSLCRERRRRRGTRWLAAAAAAVLVAGAAVWGIARDDEPETLVLASTVLEPLPSYSEAGTATVDELPDGQRELVVTASSSNANGYREVWLISADISSMVSLGTMDGLEGRFQIPAGLDLHAYPIVDISDEPLDGNPEHSGDSILRGQLEL